MTQPIPLFPELATAATSAAEVAGAGTAEGAGTGAAPGTPPPPQGRHRLRYAQRHQGEFRWASLDQLLPPDHPVRHVWAFVEQRDLTALLAPIKAVVGAPGRDATDPRILAALWLQATLDGIASARALDDLCRTHLAYQWLCGGVTLNYHTLADFRTAHADALHDWLSDSAAVLLHQGLADLERVAQDGMKVRAAAGAGSFRREPTLQRCLEAARAQVTALEQQAAEDAGAATRRQQAARQRAAEDRKERLEAALREHAELGELRAEQQRTKGIKHDPAELRISTTDPEARKMKMPDGGTRPAYNVQLATTTVGGVIVGVRVTNSGGDGGQLRPMVEQLREDYGRTPREYLVDGGFTTLDDIEGVHEEQQVQVIGPVKDVAKKQERGVDPYQPRPKDGPGVAQWRQRMGTAAAQATYKLRAATAEWANAGFRQRGCQQVTVRGQGKVLAVLLWQALAHNLRRGVALVAAAAAAVRAEPVATGG